MRRAWWVLGCVLALVAPALAVATPIVLPATPETAVEGHTVFTTIEVLPLQNASSERRFAAAVAVLVRDYAREETLLSRFAGVLWFNDQYLVSPETEETQRALPSLSEDDPSRYPCTGAVLAMNDGPSDVFPTDSQGIATNVGASYVESYLVTDPLDHSWAIDKWLADGGRPLWTVAILGQDGAANTTDDGQCQGAVYADSPCGGLPSVPGLGCAPAGPRSSAHGLPTPGYARQEGANGWGYPCGNATAPCAPLLYNALLYFRLEDLDVNGTPKDHEEESADWWDDVSGCQTGTEWPCPDEDDHREGNSHPFNPEPVWPARESAGRDNHGGSASCGSGAAECHRTPRVRIAFGYAQPQPEAERRYVVRDLEGSAAPYHCHEGMVCGPQDLGP